ncbi:MAG: TIGR03545 family protein [Candidatus Goldbacteria bacterium]|nr:TIGR03545 family protein [Candidatus Goldiibacteriota bacterium]
MKIIRPAGVIFFSVVLILIIVFNLFFLDIFIKNTLIKIGEEIFKAKVEIKSVDIKLLKSRMEIKELKIADKDNEFKNIFEAEKIVFDYEFVPLLTKKVIIDNIELAGFATGTKREKSGRLPEKRIKEIEKKEKKQNKENKIFNALVDKVGLIAEKEIKKLPLTKTIDKAISIKDKKIEDLIKKEELESYKVIISSKTKISETKNNIENKINSLNIQKRTDEIKKKVDKIKEVKIVGAADIPMATAKLKELDEIKNEVNLVKKDVDSIKSESEEFIKFTGNIPKEINLAKEKDIQMIMAKMDLDILNAKDIETALIGPIWKSRIDRILHIINTVNKYIPAGKNTKKKRYYEVVRKKGTDIHFIADNPSFWIKNIKISKSDKADGLGISGQITDLCFEQNIINKPCVIELVGKKDNKFFNAFLKIDRIDNIKDIYLIKVYGLTTDEIGLKNVDYGNIKFINGFVNAEVKANMDDNKIKIDGDINISGIRFDANDKQDILFTVLSSIENMKVVFNAIAIDSKIEFNVNSDILSRIEQALKKVYGKKIQEAHNEIEKQIGNLTKSENEILNKLSQQSLIDIKNKINELTKNTNSLDTYIENIKNEITKKINDTQKGTTDKVLKGIFK